MEVLKKKKEIEGKEKREEEEMKGKREKGKCKRSEMDGEKDFKEC